MGIETLGDNLVQQLDRLDYDLLFQVFLDVR